MKAKITMKITFLSFEYDFFRLDLQICVKTRSLIWPVQD